MANWQPYSVAVAPSPGTIEGMSACTECGKSFPDADLLRIKSSVVCAACKPEYLDKIARGAPTGKSAIFRWRKQLVISRDAELPDRRIKCNTSEGITKLKRKLIWHHPALYLTLILPYRLLIYIVIALMVRKRATVFVGLCERHRRRRVTCIVIGWVGSLLGLGGFIGGLVSTPPNLTLTIISGVLFLVAILTGPIGARVIYATKIDADFTRARGACKEFLADLPEWSGN